MSTPKKIVLKSSDGETFEVEETVALESQTIKHMIEDDCADNTIPLPNVTSKILAKVIEYCRKHVEASGAGKAADDVDKDAADEEALKKWDAKFVEVDQGVLFDLILAANYLNIKSLLDLTCQTVADMIKGKTPEEIRKTFNIKNDFTPEEEEELIADKALSLVYASPKPSYTMGIAIASKWGMGQASNLPNSYFGSGRDLLAPMNEVLRLNYV
ncbi:hypothetical protein RHMOL_Rhmol05G0065700 [Rhododendron molle]|uniref:Uncharacterized protein n=1 Tax=Rhododendron molle TaxID=49168 RepID=A0ACC0NMC8_RHOML|nr:hypothetical protein RHMOL_Rhmol05G0065700 [Rhododendron molle]